MFTTAPSSNTVLQAPRVLAGRVVADRLAMASTIPPKIIVPPFDLDSARRKVKMAEDAWNTRDPERVALAYTVDSQWRNRDEFFQGRDAIVAFLRRKWAKELDYRLKKELWAFADDRIAVRFEYEWHDARGQWWRSYGNEMWAFAPDGLMRERYASINDIAIAEADRRHRRPG